MGEPTKKLDADLLTHAEIEALLKIPSRRAPTGIRNRALLALLWRTGLRISEALALKPKDVDLDAATLIVQSGKGGKRRVLGLDAGTAALLSRWLEVRSKRRISTSAPIFCTLRGRAIDTSYVRHLLPRLAKRAGIERRVHAHGFRHRFAIDLVNEQAPITTVRDLLGHSSLSTTDRYLRRVGASEAVEFARTRSWGVMS